MKKTLIGVVALGALIASLPVLAQQKAKEPPKPVEIPKGVFLDAQPGDAYLARDTVLFAKVRDTSGKIIGDVEDLVVNTNNVIVGVVIGTGGFLGAGEKRVAVRLSALDITEKAGKTVVTLKDGTKPILTAVPAFKRTKSEKTLLDRAREKAQELTDKAMETSKDAAATAREQAGPALEKAKDAAGKAYEKAKEAVQPNQPKQ